MLIADKGLIKKNFSRHAGCYDLYSEIQDMTAKELVLRIGAQPACRILDIGCGTGNYTKLLREKFPAAAITAVDISKDMIEIAKDKLPRENLEFIVGDGENIKLKRHFDLITSNASLHWFRDIKKALCTYRELLGEGGLILFSAFGRLTFCELNSSLKESLGTDMAITADTFAGKEEMENILRSIFKESSAEEIIYKKQYASLLDLLNSIKYTGVRGIGVAKRNFWTAGAVSLVEKAYAAKFKGITATYQVFFCEAR
ncbi:MAG: malonyl-ACP O-methyltransferase BioC [Candidatus Omnitrophota bacterium]|nr:malonyl-ACP O-methyltransferase BioC [Candidatus Omnitrophota bacterium]